MIAFLIYVISIVDMIIALFMLFGIFGVIMFIISYAIFYLKKSEIEFKAKNNKEIPLDVIQDIYEDLYLAQKIKNLSRIFALLLVLSSLIPDSKTIAAMYLVPKIIENKTVSELPEKLTKLLDKKLDSWLGDLEEEKK